MNTVLACQFAGGLDAADRFEGDLCLELGCVNSALFCHFPMLLHGSFWHSDLTYSSVQIPGGIISCAICRWLRWQQPCRCSPYAPNSTLYQFGQIRGHGATPARLGLASARRARTPGSRIPTIRRLHGSRAVSPCESSPSRSAVSWTGGRSAPFAGYCASAKWMWSTRTTGGQRSFRRLRNSRRGGAVWSDPTLLQPDHLSRTGLKARLSNAAHRWMNGRITRSIAISEAVRASMLSAGKRLATGSPSYQTASRTPMSRDSSP